MLKISCQTPPKFNLSLQNSWNHVTSHDYSENKAIRVDFFGSKFVIGLFNCNDKRH